MISQVLFTSEQPKKNRMAFVGILSQIKLLFGPLVIQLVWYMLKQLFTSVSVKVVYIYLAASRLGKYPPPLFTSTSVSNCLVLRVPAHWLIFAPAQLTTTILHLLLKLLFTGYTRALHGLYTGYTWALHGLPLFFLLVFSKAALDLSTR